LIPAFFARGFLVVFFAVDFDFGLAIFLFSLTILFSLSTKVFLYERLRRYLCDYDISSTL
jgi:hypothetical protein